MSIEVEERLLRNLAKMVEVVIHDSALGVCAIDGALTGWGGTLARLASAEFRRRVMEGEVDLLSITEDELEAVVATCCASAHGRLSQAMITVLPQRKAGIEGGRP